MNGSSNQKDLLQSPEGLPLHRSLGFFGREDRFPGFGLRALGLGLGVYSSGFRVQALRFRVWGLGFWGFMQRR